MKKLFFSQYRSNDGQAENGEDGIIDAIFRELNKTCDYCIEFGAGDGIKHSITYLFRQKGSQCLLMDGVVEMHTNADGTRAPTVGETSAGSTVSSIVNNSQNVKIEFITAENINSLFEKYDVPSTPNLLVIDIDGNEYHIWKALAYRPDIITIEYNPYIRPDIKCTIPYNPEFKTTRKSKFCSATCSAFADLGIKKGYTLVDANNINLFFVANELVPKLETGKQFYNDWLFLYLKNIISSDTFEQISQLDNRFVYSALADLRNKIVELFHSGDKDLWKVLPRSDLHTYGDWEILH